MNKLTLRHLKLNKKRTIVTICGVIISVAMLTAVSTFAASLISLMRTEVKATGGNWNTSFSNVTKDDVDILKQDKNVEDYYISDQIYAKLENSQDKRHPYLFIKSLDKQGFENCYVNLKDGRLPENPSEIVISTEVKSSGKVDYKIGDKIKLETGHRVSTNSSKGNIDIWQNMSLMSDFETGQVLESFEKKGEKEYTVVGFIDKLAGTRENSPGFACVSYIDENIMTPDAFVNATYKWLTPNLYDECKELVAKMDSNNISALKTTVEYNSDLLELYGVTTNTGVMLTLATFCAIIIVIIIIGSVSLIYNAFAISVSERARNMGMLASVGATKKQKRQSVFFEGFLIGIISIPLGIIAGIVGIGITLYFVGPLMPLSFNSGSTVSLTIEPISIIIAIIFSAITIFISCYVPAKRASKISPIDAIRQTQDIKLKGTKVRTPKLITKLFGFEATIALKNLKRNKKKYRATIVSLVISILLFISVTTYTDLMNRAFDTYQPDTGAADIIFYPSGNNITDRQKIFDQISKLDEVDNYTIVKTLPSTLTVPKDKISKIAQNNSEYYSQETSEIHTQIYVLNQEQFDIYTKEIGVSQKDLTKNNSVILYSGFMTMNDGKYVRNNLVEIKENEKLDLKLINYSDNNNNNLPVLNNANVTVEKVTDKLPMGLEVGVDFMENITLFTTNDVYTKILDQYNKIDNNGQTEQISMFIDTKDNKALAVKIDNIISENSNISMRYLDLKEQQQMMSNMRTVMLVFIYGFISLITLICIANILNTISTNIQLRKREFAMFKSVGMTPKGFNKMLKFESIFFGLKSLLFGLPISFAAIALMLWSLSGSFVFSFFIPWKSILIVVVAVFAIVFTTMIYSASKVKKENIIDALKQENI